MKRVSFKVAKAINEAGYPQGHTAMCYDTNGVLCDWCKADTYVDAPFVMEVWLWLWREKDICIEIKDNHCYTTAKVANKRFHGDDPEEAIATAIEYLVDNKLLK